MGHIFISYSHTDTTYAYQLAKALQKRGFETWIDERLDYGSQWPLEIQKQLDTCAAFVLVMSPRAFSSEWVQSELSRAKRKQKPIFPLLLEGDEPWLTVESTQFIDVRGGELPPDKFYECLQEVIPSPKAPEQPVLQTLVKNESKPIRHKKSLTPVGIFSVFIVALGIGLWMLPKLSVHEPTKALAGTPTRKPASTLTNIDPPVMATVSEARTIMIDGAPDLLGKVYKSKHAADMFKPGIDELFISLKPSEKVIWSYDWCVANVKVLESNLKVMKVQFILDGTQISGLNLVQLDYVSSQGLSCHSFYTALYDWPEGTHHLRIKSVFTTTINDGVDDYEPGEYLTNYTVEVKP